MTTIPTTIEVGGKTFELGGGMLKVPIPGHEGWIWSMERQDHFISHGWFKDGQLVHADIFNAGASKFYTLMTYEGQEEPYMLDAQSGFGWTDDAWLVSQATVDSNPWDPKYDVWNDVDVTKDTGSANMNFYSPPHCLANKYGVSAAVLRFYDRYRLKQVRRPRWFLDAFGLPVGMQHPELKYEQFDEWHENVQGLNAYDLQHYDLFELYSGYMFTGDPAFLLSMINTWTHSEANGWYVRKVKDQIYGGSMRTLGWYLVASCQLYQMLIKTGVFKALANRVKDTIIWHVNNGIEKFPISSPWYQGSIPQIFKDHKKNYIFGWQYAVVAHGYQWVYDTFVDSDPELAEKAQGHADQILTYIAAHSDDGPDPANPGAGWVGYIWSPDEDPMFHIKGVPPGVNDWNLAPMMRHSGEKYPMRDSLIQAIIDRGWNKQSHKYFTYAVNVMGEGIWEIAT